MEIKRAQIIPSQNLTYATQLHIIAEMEYFNPDKIMKSFHLRSTKVRHALICILYQNNQPLSVATLTDHLKTQFKITTNKTTLYRQLDLLENKKIISIYEVEGIKHFQFNHSHSHQYLFCHSCHQFIPLKSEPIITLKDIQNIEKKHHFTISHHSTLYFGQCHSCKP